MNKKSQMCAALRAFINQRSGIDFRNYASGDWKASREAFMGDYRPMLKSGKQARQMLVAVENCDGITDQDLMQASRAYSGRLQFVERDGAIWCDYTTGQYFPTEYRKAACAVLAQCLWDHLLNEAQNNKKAVEACNTGGYIRKQALLWFGRGIQRDWFN